MSSLVYNSGLEDALTGNIDFASDKFKVMLVGGGYAPNRGHTKADVTDEVSGLGYVSGGADAQIVVTKGDDKVDVEMGSASWQRATITARGAVYYKDGGELVAYIDFGSDVVSTNGEFSLSPSILRIQN
jgi:hypothetical protein